MCVSEQHQHCTTCGVASAGSLCCACLSTTHTVHAWIWLAATKEPAPIFVCLRCLSLCRHPARLLRALQESKRGLAKLSKEKHAADLAAAELRGKAEAERDTQRMEVQMAQQQLEAARAQVARLEGDIKDYKARAQVGVGVGWWCRCWCCGVVCCVVVGWACRTLGCCMGFFGAAAALRACRYVFGCSWAVVSSRLCGKELGAPSGS